MNQVAAGALDPQGPVARTIADLWWWMLVLGFAVFLVFAVALGMALWRRREPGDGSQVSADIRRSGRWIVLGGVVMPVLVLTLVFGLTVRAMTTAPGDVPPVALAVEVVGHQWWYEVRYPDAGVVRANELHLPVHRPVACRLVRLYAAQRSRVLPRPGHRLLGPGPRRGRGRGVLRLLVAAPLLALSAPLGALLRGVPPGVRRMAMRWRRRLRLSPRRLRPLLHPAAVWLLHVGTLWFWHASVPYQAALENRLVHAAGHASFLVTGALFWGVVLGRPAGSRVSYGGGMLLVFAAAMHSVFLSALLTFAGTPWYPEYRETTGPWGLEPPADQQLAGAIMWVPAGLVYVGAALALLVAWVRSTDEGEAALKTHAPPYSAARGG